MKINVVDLKPGMLLESDVKGTNGRLLLPTGTELTEQHLRIFNIWGVTEVEITSATDEQITDSENGEYKLIREQAANHGEYLFKHADMDIEPMEVFKKACINDFESRLKEKNRLSQLPSTLIDKPDIPGSPVFTDAHTFLDGGIRLSSFSDIYYKITDALDNPSSTANTFADIISKDSGLSARLISLVNSPLYGFSTPVESLSRAVSLVGTKGLSQLALSVSVMESFKGMDSRYFCMADFWKHSLACAVFCRILSSQIPGTSQDNCFVVGMLHDLGRLVMLQLAPTETRLSLNLSKCHGLDTCGAERKVFGFDHCELADELFKLWNFPPSIARAVVGHHGQHEKVLPIESAICSLGDTMAIAMQYGSNGSGFVQAPYRGAWDAMGLPKGSLGTTILKAKRQIADILTIFGV